MSGRFHALLVLEHGLMAGGLVFLALFTAAVADRAISSRLGLRAFDHAQAAERSLDQQSAPSAGAPAAVDFHLWSPQRVKAYRASVAAGEAVPLAVIRIRKADLRVPVYEGTDSVALNRGAGWIPGTARPGESGNIGIAGHRDGFFRALKYVTTGDAIELETLRNTTVYTVDRIEIVTPHQVEVLRTGGGSTLTLVTCYPFYFVGSAPKRYVVHASLSLRQPAVHRVVGQSDKEEIKK